VFRAYFDEGSIAELDRAAAFAGFMGNETECDETASKWKEIVQPIGEFHATDFFGRGPFGCMLGRYDGLNPDEADGAVSRLIDLLYESKLEPIGMAIDAKVFRTLSEDERRWMTAAVVYDKTWSSQGSPKNPQFACFNYCLTEANKFTPVDEKMFITCARTTQFESTMSKIYGHFLVLEDSAGKRGERLGEAIAFSSPKECPLIQAADLLAFAIGRNVAPKNTNGPVIQYAIEKLALNREYVRAMDQPAIDVHLRRHPFRTTFWQGMTEPDYFEELRSQGIDVLVSKVSEGMYRTHQLNPRNVQIVCDHFLEDLNRTQCLSDETKATGVSESNKKDSPQD